MGGVAMGGPVSMAMGSHAAGPGVGTGGRRMGETAPQPAGIASNHAACSSAVAGSMDAQ